MAVAQLAESVRDPIEVDYGVVVRRNLMASWSKFVLSLCQLYAAMKW